MGLLGPKEVVQGGAQGSPPKGLYKQRGRLKTLTLATVRPLFWPPLLCAKPLVALADLAVRIAAVLPVRVDFVEVQRLLHKDEPFERRFSQLHCRLPSALHRRATEVP